MKNSGILAKLTSFFKKIDEDVTARCAENSLELEKRNLAVEQELKELGLDSIEEAEQFIRTLQLKE